MGSYLNPGSMLFRGSLRSKIYIDKSGLIEKINELVCTEQKYVCVSRPRRFGKSMAANMLAAYYKKDEDTKPLFDKLLISQAKSYEEHLNQYDVIRINMQQFLSETHNMEEMLSKLRNYLIMDLQEAYEKIRFREKTSLVQTMKDVFAYTGCPFIILIDEWDCLFREYQKDKEAQKKYLDFGAGIAVFALGYGNEAYNQALKDQIDKLIHTSNLYYNIPAVEAAKKIVDASGLKKVFFTNSGTEAIEGALKVARKYAYNKDDSKDYEFIAMNHSFHGRSQGALSVTGNSHYQDGFVPKEFRAVFAEFNNLEDVVSKITDKTCGIICEVVQGEGGIFPADKEFLEGLRKVCDEKDILLIFDEIQCGMGRCGSLFAHDLYGVKPDVLTLAKALGCGVPVGAFVVGEKADGALVPGDHGTTYGGNPFAAAAINAVFDQFEKLQVPEHAKEIGAYLWDKLEELKERYDCITGHRGIALMQGLEFDTDHPVGDIVKKALEKGLIIISAGNNVIRFVPPLVIEKEHVDEMISILEDCIA